MFLICFYFYKDRQQATGQMEKRRPRVHTYTHTHIHHACYNGLTIQRKTSVKLMLTAGLIDTNFQCLTTQLLWHMFCLKQVNWNLVQPIKLQIKLLIVCFLCFLITQTQARNLTHTHTHTHVRACMWLKLVSPFGRSFWSLLLSLIHI